MTDGTDYLLAACIALVISMALVPLLVRAAPRMGLMDMPDSRKVHALPVPRVGGLAIVIGGLVAMLLWLPLDRLMQSYFLGVAVLVIFGGWDDAREIGHYRKFIGQVLAVLIVVLYGDLYVTRLPFGFESLPAEFGKPFTVFAIVGVINAINHSDGLDGLAGGESLLSLVAIAYLAYLGGGADAVLIAVAMAGGVLGFLRFNTCPARIFMGDAGSQVLGFTLGFLAVLLTQRINSALSAAVPALLLGLPISDILAVLYLRIRHGMNWFRATKNHIHHRLLGLGFAHHESVMVIYSIQALLVLLAVGLRYESDILVLAIYLAIIAGVFAALTMAERCGWHAHSHRPTSRILRAVGGLKHDPRVANWPLFALHGLIPGYVILVTTAADSVPYDMGLVAAVLLVVFVLDLAYEGRHASTIVRGVAYITVVFAVYLEVEYAPAVLRSYEQWGIALFGVIIAAIALNLRFGEQKEFALTPLDYLVVCGAIGVVLVTDEPFFSQGAGAMAIRAIVLMYGCELLLSTGRRRLTPLNIAAALALGVIVIRGM